jgi:hypothetical protein
MSPDLQDKLFKKYPKIFSQIKKSPQESAMAWGITCDDGWFDLIDRLCWFIQCYIDNNPHLQTTQVVAQEVKAKLAGLRFTTSGGDELICGAINFAEALSFSICELCGVNGSKPFNDGGYYWTACNKCKNMKDIT